MTLEQLLDVEDALECQIRTDMTRADFLSASKPAAREKHGLAWDEAVSMVIRCGTSRRAWFELQRRIDSYRSNQYA